MPAELVESLDEDIAAAAVGFADLRDAVLGPLQREDGRDLDRSEGTVVKVALEFCQSIDQHRIADHEADAPAGHIVGLRESKELDSDLFRARNLEHAGRLIAVEAK